MDQITREDFSNWLKQTATPCVSIFMPVHPGTDQVQQDSIRLKNLLQEANERLNERGVRSAESKNMLESAQLLIQNDDFWKYQVGGLALFIAPGELQTYRVPLNFEELVIVGDQYYIKPLLPLLQKDGRFYLLALSQGQVRFYQGSRYNLDELELTDMPTNLDDYLEEVAGPEPFSHPEGDAKAARLSDGFDLKRKNDILHFFQRVDKTLQPRFLATETAPLVLAGVEFLIPIYRDASAYRNIRDEAILGNPEGLKIKELHEKAWQIVAPIFEQELEQVAGLFQQLIGQESGRASSDIREIVPAAYSGRVGQLFIMENQEVWGKYDLANNRVELSEDVSIDQEDLLNFVATQTLMNGGEVYTIQSEELPVSVPIAAIFRY